MCVCVLVSVCARTVAKWDWSVNFFLEFFEHFLAGPFYARAGSLPYREKTSTRQAGNRLEHDAGPQHHGAAALTGNKNGPARARGSRSSDWLEATKNKSLKSIKNQPHADKVRCLPTKGAAVLRFGGSTLTKWESRQRDRPGCRHRRPPDGLGGTCAKRGRGLRPPGHVTGRRY